MSAVFRLGVIASAVRVVTAVNQTRLLLHFDGANNSTTVDDSSVYGPRSAVAVGNAKLSTAQSKFGTASLTLDGSGDWVQVAPASGALPADFQLAGKDFTIEAFVYQTSSAAAVIYTTRNDGVGTSGLNIQLKADGNLRVIVNSSTYDGTGATVALNTWTHVAVVVRGLTMWMFVGGVLVATNTISALTDPSGYGVRIGASNDGGGAFTGYIDELRFSTVAVYTKAFTPPASAFTSDSPAPSVPASLLLHFDGANNSTTFTDSSPYGPRSASAASNAKLSTAQQKFGTASLTLDGSSWVQVVASGSIPTELQLAGVDYTIEAWVYNTAANECVIYSCRGDGADTFGMYLGIRSTGLLFAQVNSALYDAPTGTISLNTWTHVAVSVQGSTMRMFVNGTKVYDAATVSVTNTTTRGIRIGASNNGFAVFTGYIDEVRVTVGAGAALYTANFTPPASAFP